MDMVLQVYRRFPWPNSWDLTSFFTFLLFWKQREWRGEEETFFQPGIINLPRINAAEEFMLVLHMYVYYGVRQERRSNLLIIACYIYIYTRSKSTGINGRLDFESAWFYTPWRDIYIYVCTVHVHVPQSQDHIAVKTNTMQWLHTNCILHDWLKEILIASTVLSICLSLNVHVDANSVINNVMFQIDISPSNRKDFFSISFTYIIYTPRPGVSRLIPSEDQM